jgi:hypothetical protein
MISGEKSTARCVISEVAEGISGIAIKTVIGEIVEGVVQKVAAAIERSAGDSGELGVIQLDRLKKLFHSFPRIVWLPV